MHNDAWIMLAVVVGGYWLYTHGHAAGVATATGGGGLPTGVNPLGDVFNTGTPAAPSVPDTGNGGATGTYGPGKTPTVDSSGPVAPGRDFPPRDVLAL